MKRVIVICLFVSVVLILSGCVNTQQKSDPKIVRFPTSAPGEIKAMSFNIRVDTILDGLNRWSGRRKIVYDILADNAADVVGVQEALDHQVRQIQRALPQYDHYAVGRNDGREKGESCAIFYRKDRFSLTDCGTFWFSDTPSKPGSKDWGNIWPRICSWVYLTEKITGNGFYVYNVHLAVLSQNSRQKSVELLAKRIAARKPNDPFIVMGDFNMKLDNPAMVYLQNTDSETPYPRMQDAWRSLYPDGICKGTQPGLLGLSSGPKIDHIPVCEGAKVLDVQIDRRKVNGRYASDHFPIIAKIDLAGLPNKLEPVAAEINPRKRQQNQP
jgi:endonuclease/exonuclease/phosphatase family metal-dependent hydrolase